MIIFGEIKMRIQHILAATTLALTMVSTTVTAAIVNQVDFPEAFTTVKDKVQSETQENLTATDLHKDAQK